VVFRFGQEARQILVEKGRAAAVLLASGERLDAGAVVVNADAAALAEGLLGEPASSCVKPLAPRDRSLSAMTWAMTAQTDGFPLLHHNVFFSADYAREFEQIFGQSRLPDAPTVYVCAQDRSQNAAPACERLFLLMNAPATGDRKHFSAEEATQCQTRVFRLLERCGLTIRPRATQVTTPTDFHRLFPGTGGALYGRASHGWMASFRRPSSATAIPGLYLAGGSTHPGAGVPMAALSGRLAAQRLISDRASTRAFHPGAIFGGISTASAPTGVMRSP
jgi:1-hydroxycarotenoid 3,4-desaturase